MKTNTVLNIFAVTGALLISLGTTFGEPTPNRHVAVSTGGGGGGGAVTVDPATGLPTAMPPRLMGLSGSPVGAVAPGAMAFDPATGLPLAAPAERPWMDEDWKEPAKRVAEVNYDGLPLIEITHDLEKQFPGLFDILLPQDYEGNATPGQEQRDWTQTIVHLRMKNVAASEVFNAMNLLFENNRTPLRWELRVTPHRQLALLRVLDRSSFQASGIPQPLVKRVYFVGQLLGDDKSGGMTMPQVIDTVSSVYKMSYGKPPSGIQFHVDAQLLIVTGTIEQMSLIDQTLEGLKQKVELDRKRAQRLSGRSAEPKSEPGPNAKPPE